MNKTKGSDIVKQFLDYATECERKYRYAYEKVGEQDKLSNDLLHKLELEDINYKERNAVAKKLQTNRKDRRYYKDITEECSPIKDFLNNPQNKKTIEQMKQMLGELRRVEEYHKDRKYIPRIEKERV